MDDKAFYAQFAFGAYNYNLVPGSTLNYAPGFTVVAVSQNTGSGFNGFAAFNASDCRLVTANAGTDGFKDVLADITLATGNGNVQVPDSLALTNQALKILSDPKMNPNQCRVVLIEVGHSLGGDTGAEAATATGAKAYAYNAPGAGGIWGSVGRMIGINAVSPSEVYYVDSEVDGFANWMITSIGHRFSSSSDGMAGLLGGTLMPVDRTTAAGSVGHSMQQLMGWLVDPASASQWLDMCENNAVLDVVSDALQHVIPGSEVDRGELLRNAISEMKNLSAGGAAGGFRIVQAEHGALIVPDRRQAIDLTSEYARKIGIEAYVERNNELARQEALDRARADAAMNGHHPDNGGGGTSSSGSRPNTTTTTTTKTTTFSADPSKSSVVVGGGTTYVGAYTSYTGTTKTTTYSEPKVGPQPVLLDLNGNGIEIRGADESPTYLDSSGDGLSHRSAWAGSGDGVLFYDVGGDGVIKESREYVFTEWDPTAKDDMAALRAKFDTNGDGKLTAADAEFANFKVMVTNADGSQTAMTLGDRGITEIDLKTDVPRPQPVDHRQLSHPSRGDADRLGRGRSPQGPFRGPALGPGAPRNDGADRLVQPHGAGGRGPDARADAGGHRAFVVREHPPVRRRQRPPRPRSCREIPGAEYWSTEPDCSVLDHRAGSEELL